jgi:hypothetical protein
MTMESAVAPTRCIYQAKHQLATQKFCLSKFFGAAGKFSAAPNA